MFVYLLEAPHLALVDLCQVLMSCPLNQLVLRHLDLFLGLSLHDDNLGNPLPRGSFLA